MCFPWCINEIDNEVAVHPTQSRKSASQTSIQSGYSTKLDVSDFQTQNSHNTIGFYPHSSKTQTETPEENESKQESSKSSPMPKWNKQVNVVNAKYKIGPLIGSGSFGTVYECANDENIAIKILKQQGHQSYDRETTVLSYLQKFHNVRGVPKLYFYGKTPYGYRDRDVIVMSRCGQDLSTLFNDSGKQFTLPTVLKLAVKFLHILKDIHNANIVHRDIKPHNFLMGYGRNINETYLIDFGLAKHFRDDDSMHIPFRTGLTPVGTARYASMWTHQGMTQSRRDDLEAFGFMLVYFYFGKLPWQGIPMRNRKDKWTKIGNAKMKTSLDDLCHGLPNQFIQYFQYVRKLKFADNPDYEYMISLFISAAQDNNIEIEKVVWDWDK